MTLRNAEARVQRIVLYTAIEISATVVFYTCHKQRLSSPSTRIAFAAQSEMRSTATPQRIVQRVGCCPSTCDENRARAAANLALGLKKCRVVAIGFDQRNVLHFKGACGLELPHSVLGHLNEGDRRPWQGPVLVVDQRELARQIGV